MINGRNDHPYPNGNRSDLMNLYNLRLYRDNPCHGYCHNSVHYIAKLLREHGRRILGEKGHNSFFYNNWEYGGMGELTGETTWFLRENVYNNMFYNVWGYGELTGETIALTLKR